jgi:ABC-2 type transport system ATP-binding protein
VIEVRGLVVRYGQKTAVNGIDFEVRSGEVVALLGPNGAGKTSTVETLEGYRRRSAGTVSVIGLDPGEAADHRKLRSRIGVMLQRGGIYPGMGAREVLRLFASYYPDPLLPDELIERLDLTSVAATPWRRLSGGEQQRLSLALALVGRPEVAFLDEPTAGVDPGGRRAIRTAIEELRRRKACVLLTTHELEEAERVADRILILDEGNIVAEGTAAELISRSPEAQQFRFSAIAGIDVQALEAVVRAAVTEDRPGEYTVSAPGSPARIAALTAWLAERDLTITDLRTGSRLEDVFLRLTGGSDR